MYTYIDPKFNLKNTLLCGQCFRWRLHSDTYYGVVESHLLGVRQNNTQLHVTVSPSVSNDQFVRDYFNCAFSSDEILKSFPIDVYVKQAMVASEGIRILKQDLWETIASFIISINKNIPAIITIIENLSMQYGKKIDVGTSLDLKDHYSFPDIATIARTTPSALRESGMGFRAEYLSKTSQMIEDGVIDLSNLKKMGIDEALSVLQTLPGVGPKVANCILLYGCNRYDAFPIDVWMKRILEECYFKGNKVPLKKLGQFAKKYFGPYRGYVQQYLYYWARSQGKKNK
ncbi:MAG: DNA glycosylase [Candidatus Ancaeobacter aquaticus]|nr:DNA glycosylase [Candidatus Ancaeobacter aquaticus]